MTREPIFNKPELFMFVAYTAVMCCLGWFIAFGLHSWGNKFLVGGLAVILTVAWLFDRSERRAAEREKSAE